MLWRDLSFLFLRTVLFVSRHKNRKSKQPTNQQTPPLPHQSTLKPKQKILRDVAPKRSGKGGGQLPEPGSRDIRRERERERETILCVVCVCFTLKIVSCVPTCFPPPPYFGDRDALWAVCIMNANLFPNTTPRSIYGCIHFSKPRFAANRKKKKRSFQHSFG